MDDGSNNLQDYVNSYLNRTCANDRDGSIALVGYSMGAWVIHRWLATNTDEWKYVSTVILYGDPCYTNSENDEGLARLLVNSAGCDPGKYYPYPAPAAGEKISFYTRSYTLWHDPVSGYGFRAGGNPLVPTVEARRARQLAEAAKCDSSSCPHLQYQAGRAGAGRVEAGAQIVAGDLS